MRESTITNQPLNCNSFYPFPTPQKNNPPNLHIKAWNTVVTPIAVQNIGVLKQHVTKNHSWGLFGGNNNVNNQIIWTGEARAPGQRSPGVPTVAKNRRTCGKTINKKRHDSVARSTKSGCKCGPKTMGTAQHTKCAESSVRGGPGSSLGQLILTVQLVCIRDNKSHTETSNVTLRVRQAGYLL